MIRSARLGHGRQMPKPLFPDAELIGTLDHDRADAAFGWSPPPFWAPSVIIDEIGFAPLDEKGGRPFVRLDTAGADDDALDLGSHRPVDWFGGPPARSPWSVSSGGCESGPPGVGTEGVLRVHPGPHGRSKADVPGSASVTIPAPETAGGGAGFAPESAPCVRRRNVRERRPSMAGAGEHPAVRPAPSLRSRGLVDGGGGAGLEGPGCSWLARRGRGGPRRTVRRAGSAAPAFIPGRAGPGSPGGLGHRGRWGCAEALALAGGARWSVAAAGMAGWCFMWNETQWRSPSPSQPLPVDLFHVKRAWNGRGCLTRGARDGRMGG